MAESVVNESWLTWWWACRTTRAFIYISADSQKSFKHSKDGEDRYPTEVSEDGRHAKRSSVVAGGIPYVSQALEKASDPRQAHAQAIPLESSTASIIYTLQPFDQLIFASTDLMAIFCLEMAFVTLTSKHRRLRKSKKGTRGSSKWSGLSPIILSLFRITPRNLYRRLT